MRWLILLLFAGTAQAEGARMQMDCTYATACSANGDCVTGIGPIAFSISPKEIDAEGRGTYEVSAGNAEPEIAQGLSQTGPFLWMPSSGQRMVLTLTGDTTALWVRQILPGGTETAPSTEIDLMTCEVTF